jgi:hypothetical protein
MLDMSAQAYGNLWQYYSDTMEWAFTAADNEADRMNAIATTSIASNANITAEKMKNNMSWSSSLGEFTTDFIKKEFLGWDI